MGELIAGHVRVAEVAALAPGEAKTFTFDRDGETVEAFVLRVPGEDDVLVAYVNRCAHVAFDLDMGTGRFWSPKTGRIYCMTHGARYEPRTGECDAGPCVGARLTKLAVRRDGRDALVEIPAQGPETAR